MGGVLFECHNITGRAISDMGIKMESTPWIPREIRVIIFLGVQKPVGGVVPMCIKVVGIPLPAGQCVYSLGFESRPSKDENNKNKRCFFHDIVVLKVIHESVFFGLIGFIDGHSMTRRAVWEPWGEWRVKR